MNFGNINYLPFIKKESPNEGTETVFQPRLVVPTAVIIKKESPNEGTETTGWNVLLPPLAISIKKESPNEGTETISTAYVYLVEVTLNKKRIPE